MQAASFLCFVVGIFEIVWGFWDFSNKDASPSIASRFASGIIFLAVSFITYLFARKRPRLF